jgi:GT2 family glycosyltransferase
MIKTCLSSVFASNYPRFEVILVDNGSTDKSLEIVHQEFKNESRLKIISCNTNKGYAGGNNIGFRNSNGQYVFFLNNDAIVTSNCIKELVCKITSDSSIGIVQCKMLSLDNPGILDCIGGYMDSLGFTYIGKGEEDKGQYTAESIFYADGVAFLISKSIGEQCSVNNDLFDEDYFPIYYDDVDLSWRIRLAGYKIVVDHDAIVFHTRGATTSLHIKSTLLIYSFTRNRLITLMKNYNLTNLLKVLPALYLIEITKGLMLLRYDLKKSISVFRALVYVFFNLKSIYEKRLIIRKRIKRVSDCEVLRFLSKGSYILMHFRNFKQLIK